jgi:CRISPR/Cas system-associated exonuclease Cas4 (RecB family)
VKKHNDAKLVVNDYSEIRNEYVVSLKDTLHSIFDKNEPFKMTSHLRKCENCPYKQMCQR